MVRGKDEVPVDSPPDDPLILGRSRPASVILVLGLFCYAKEPSASDLPIFFMPSEVKRRCVEANTGSRVKYTFKNPVL